VSIGKKNEREGEKKAEKSAVPGKAGWQGRTKKFIKKRLEGKVRIGVPRPKKTFGKITKKQKTEDGLISSKTLTP